MTSLDQINAWRDRLYTQQLSWGAELWDFTRTRPAVHARLMKMPTVNPEMFHDPHQVDQLLVDFLLWELINAGEGVIRSYLSMLSYVAEARAAVSEHVATVSEANARPEYGWYFSNQPVTAVWYEFINLVVWARTLSDRVTRRGMNGDPRQGLLPNLAPGPLRDRVQSAHDKLLAGRSAEARLLANYSVHGGLMQTGTQRGRITEDDVLVFEMPNEISTNVDHFYEFRWDHKRTLEQFADQLIAETVAFVDEVLSAFEEAVPERFRH